MKKYRKHMRDEIEITRIKYDRERKKQYDKTRVAATYYAPNQDVYVDTSVGKVGNRRKLPINRKKGTIIDQIGENAYTVKYYDDGKVEPVNVERMYIINEDKKIDDAKQSQKPKLSRSAKNNRRRRRSKQQNEN